jgi:hypothetical protein
MRAARHTAGSDASPPERTTGALARQANLSPQQVAARLGELEARSPSLVRRVYDETWQVQAWTPTDAARGAHEQWCRACRSWELW